MWRVHQAFSLIYFRSLKQRPRKKYLSSRQISNPIYFCGRIFAMPVCMLRISGTRIHDVRCHFFDYINNSNIHGMPPDINRKVNWNEVVYKWPSLQLISFWATLLLSCVCVCFILHDPVLSLALLLDVRMNDGEMAHNMLIKSIFLSDRHRKGVKLLFL